MKTFPKLLWLILFVLSAKSADIESVGYLAFENGYRWDRISNRVSLGGPNLGVSGSTQKLRDISSYQIGGVGLWNFYNCAFVGGEGHYGWAGKGKYSEGGFRGNTHGHTYDGKGVVGYNFNMAKGIWVAPIVGYSYDALQLKGTDIHVVINGVDHRLRGIKADQRFQGPFVGFDIIYEVNEAINLTFGYEAHFAKWHGDRLIERRDYGDSPLFGLTTAFSNTRHLKNAFGQLFTFDFNYQFCSCWTVGVKLKYQFYQGDFGKYKQKREPILPLVTYANVDGLRWLSFASTITIGRTF